MVSWTFPSTFSTRRQPLTSPTLPLLIRGHSETRIFHQAHAALAMKCFVAFARPGPLALLSLTFFRVCPSDCLFPNPSKTCCAPPEHGEEAIKELHADFNIPASFYRVDVRDPIAVEEAINGIVRDFGSVDVLLCSAGTSFRISKINNHEFLTIKPNK